MNQLISNPDVPTHSVIMRSGERANTRFWEFFVVNIRNPNTRRAYGLAIRRFLDWCESQGLRSIPNVQPIHIGVYIEALTRSHSAPTAKQHLAAIRGLFNWLVTGQIMPMSAAASVRGPKHIVKIGKTPILESEEARRLLDSIDLTTPVGLRDRALISLMIYTFARVGAALAMKVEDVYVQNHRLWVRLHEKGGKRHEMPCHHNLEIYLRAYIDKCGLTGHQKRSLFPTIRRFTGELTEIPLAQTNAHAMIRRRTLVAGILTKVNNHSFRATGITTYLKNGGTLEKAAMMANHASMRTTQLYDRRREEMSLDDVEKIMI